MQEQQPIRVLLVDDEAIIRYGLVAIADCSPEIEIVGEASHGQEAIAQAQALQPDIVLMDIAMPVLDGIAATQAICQTLPQTKVLILTTHDEDQYLTQAMQQGAAGYLLKNTCPQDFVYILQTTHRGYLQFSPSLSHKIFRASQPSALATASTPATTPDPSVDLANAAPTDWKGATPREREVIQLIAEGANNREIAKALYITEKTVKNHVSNILSRTGLRNRTQLAIWANTAQVNPVYSLSA